MRPPCSRTVTNFGGEVSFAPKKIYRPGSEGEVLGILDRHKGQSIRAVGSLHSWNRGIECDVLIDLGKLSGVSLTGTPQGVMAEAGGGCTLHALQSSLSESGLTLPTLGAITKQTIAGAVSTATHGSGKHSISHYMERLRVAAYGADGKARIFEWQGSDRELLAARCAAGCMGIVLSAGFRPLPEYNIEEKGQRCADLQDALSREREFPLQQFLLVPYSWEYFSFQRRVTDESEGWLKRSFWKAYDFLTFELGAHLMLKAALLVSSITGSRSIIPAFYEKVVPPFLPTHRFVNPSADGLTLHTSHHYMFRHLEMELFIPERRLADAVSLARSMTSSFADASFELPQDAAAMLRSAGLYERVMGLRGTYQHHYPLFFRSVHPDDALISMSSGEKHYSMSLFTYLSPDARQPYYDYAACVAAALNSLFEARLHWGKYFPLAAEDIARLYPSLDEFRGLCRSADPAGSFRNGFARRALGF